MIHGRPTATLGIFKELEASEHRTLVVTSGSIRFRPCGLFGREGSGPALSGRGKLNNACVAPPT